MNSLKLFTIMEFQALEFLNVKLKVSKFFVTSKVRPAVICRNSNVKLKVSTVKKAGS